MPELLIELFTEEIPARMQSRAAEDFRRLMTEKLTAAGLGFTDARSYVTPRRLALAVEGLPERQPDVTEERRGPRVGAPDQAIQGFLKGAGLASLDQAEQRDTGKGVFWFAVARKAGRPTAEVVAEALSDTLRAFPWPKSMRWPGPDFEWVRPLRGVLALFGARPIGEPGYEASNETVGHRFLAPEAIRVESFADYKEKLESAYVLLDPLDRKERIVTDAERLARDASLALRSDPALLEEVAGLVEWPVVLMGHIEERFMALPPEVLTTTMRANQKYFALEDGAGKLAPRFLVVANIEPKDGGAAIVAGNERVLRARLADAEFFWNQDRKIPLEQRLSALREIVFHAKLGTLAEKARRVAVLAREIAQRIPGADASQAERAARLAKADLVTGVVGEFPELQGAMGRYYALEGGEPAPVAEAIADHYAPQGPNDRCPTAPVSVAVALADKIDTLAGFFAIGETPTGSKDPFALRRAALGVIRLIVENGLRLGLSEFFRKANHLLAEMEAGTDTPSTFDTGTLLAFLADRLRVHLREKGVRHDLIAAVFALGGEDDLVRLLAQMQAGIEGKFEPAELLEFLADRLRVHLREKGVRHDLIAAVFALGGEDDLVRLLARVDALQRFLKGEDGANLLVAFRRAANILKIEEQRDKTRYGPEVDAGLLRLPEETALHAALGEASGALSAALDAERFEEAMRLLARLRPVVDAFFDKVTVNAPEAELRANRLRLLAAIPATLGRVADFSRIEG